MTRVNFKNVSGPLSEYAEKARQAPVIVIKGGKPFAAVVPIRNADEETIALSTSRKFLNLIFPAACCGHHQMGFPKGASIPFGRGRG